MKTAQIGRNIFRQSTLAFVFCTSLTFAGAALTNACQAAANDPMLFFNAGYNYCDAQLLAAFWNVDVAQAKATAGSKIRVNGKKTGKKLIAANLASARGGQNPCSFEDVGISFQEMNELAAFWGLPIMEAKTKVANLLFQGRRGDVASARKNAAH